MLGFLGSLPQAYLVYKNRHRLQDLSLVSQVIIVVALGCSAAYAFLNGAWVAFGIWAVQFSWTAWKAVAVARSNRNRELEKFK